MKWGRPFSSTANSILILLTSSLLPLSSFLSFLLLFPKVVRPVKLAAVNTLLVYLKHLRKAEYRESICSRLVTGT